MRNFLLAIFVICFLYSNLGWSQDPIHRILVLIGYSDVHTESIKDLTKVAYYPRVGFNSERKILQILSEFGLNGQDHRRYQNQFGNVEVQIININSICSENSKDVYTKCSDQAKISLSARLYLDRNLNKYDEFFYIGHSRLGQGLALGPFSGEFTYDFRFYNNIELGRLKKIVLASCDSDRLYRNHFADVERIEFVGTLGQKYWDTDLDPMIQKELRLSLIKFRPQ